MEKEAIGYGHWIFAGVFLILFVIAMIYAYRKDLKRLKPYYRHVWKIILLILVIYFFIYFLVKLT